MKNGYACTCQGALSGLIILVGYLVVAILVARLRHALHNADQRFSRLVEGLPVAVAGPLALGHEDEPFHGTNRLIEP